MKVVEPSEILVGKKHQHRPQETTFRKNPGIRFLARLFDYALWMAFLYGVHRFLGGRSFFTSGETLIPYEYAAWIPVETLFLFLFGKTPGKWLLGMKVKQGKRRRIGMATALRRSFFVWMRGLGMMIPILNFFCLLVAYQRFKTLGVTSWDRDEYTQVSSEQVARWRVVFAVVVVIAVGFYRYLLAKLYT